MTVTYHAGRRIQGNTSEYKVHTFTSTGNTIFAVTGSGDIEYLVVAGGAGGGHGGSHEPGGGGGATKAVAAAEGGNASAEIAKIS